MALLLCYFFLQDKKHVNISINYWGAEGRDELIALASITIQEVIQIRFEIVIELIINDLCVGYHSKFSFFT